MVIYVVNIIEINKLYHQINKYFKKNVIEGDPCSLPSGNKGVCQPLLDCVWLHDEIRSHRILIKDLVKYRCTFRVRA